MIKNTYLNAIDLMYVVLMYVVLGVPNGQCLVLLRDISRL